MNLKILEFVAVGEQAPRVRIYDWLTEEVRYYNGMRQVNQLLDRPIRTWRLRWDWLTLTTKNNLVEAFNRAAGRFRTFLLYDWEDYACSLTECSYTPTITETTTQLIKTYHVGDSGAWTENKTRIMPSDVFAPVIKINGTTKTEGTHFTLDDNTGIINWAGGSSPVGSLVAGQTLTAQYQYYFPVAFSSDTFAEVEHQKGYYSADGGVELIEIIE